MLAALTSLACQLKQQKVDGEAAVTSTPTPCLPLPLPVWTLAAYSHFQFVAQLRVASSPYRRLIPVEVVKDSCLDLCPRENYPHTGANVRSQARDVGPHLFIYLSIYFPYF